MKRRGTFQRQVKPLTSFGRGARVLSALAALTFGVLIETANPEAHNAHPTQTTLTPLQRAIERERQRLGSSDAEERRDAVLRLGAIARPESARVAATALPDASAMVRATAARAVLSLPPEEAAALLLPLLNDRDEFVRREAAYALGQTRRRAAVPALVGALERDKSPSVRGAAAVSLGIIGDPAATGALAQAMVRRVPRSGFFNRLARRREAENEFVRRAAARSLGEIGSRDAVQPLTDALLNDRAGDDVRREAARSLGLIGDPAAIPALQRAARDARDPYFSEHITEALRRIETAGARKLL